MKDVKKKNILYLVSSKGVSRIGDTMFDFANNTFLAGINPTSLSLVAVYQSLESVIGVLFNLFGGVFADSFKRKKIIIATNESSIMKLATSPCLKIFVLLSFSKPVISFDNRLETVRLSSQG